MTRRRSRGKRTRNKRRTTRRSIPPATAYAFIIIHEIPRRRFCELPSALRTGLKRLIEKRRRRRRRGGRRGGGRRAGGLSSEEKIYRRNKSKMSYPPYEQRQRAKPTGERVEERIKRMRGRGGEGKKDPGRGGSLLLYGNLNF